MKYLLMLLCLVSMNAFSSEREDYGNSCDRIVSQIAAKYRALSEISARLMALNQDGPENYSVDFHESENCETVVSDYQILIRQKTRHEQELLALQKERRKICPKVYPE